MLPGMRTRPLLAFALVAAVAVRAVALGDRMSPDEGYTWLVASAHGLGTLLDRLAAFENTPPLYYLLAWPLPADSEVWLRLPSLVAGVACVAALYAAIRPLAGERAALLAAGALAVAPYAVSYSDFARGFVLADLGLVVALAAAVRRSWWLYTAGAAVALYAEYDSALFLVALTGSLVWSGRVAAREALVRGLTPLLVLVPWIPEIARGHDADGITKVAPVYPGPSPVSLRDACVRLVFGEHGTAHAAGLRWLQFLALALVLGLALRLLERPVARLLGGTALGVLVLHALAHWIGPDVFAPRYMTELVPLACAITGIGVARVRIPAAVSVAAAALAVLGIAVVVQRSGRELEPDVAGVAHLVAPGARGRVVITNSAVVAFYGRDLHPVLDRPFGLGPGLEAGCVHPCRAPFLIIDDARVAGGPRRGRGSASAFGPIYVRAAPKVGRLGAVEGQGGMSSLACSLALLFASSFAGVGVPHPMEVTVQDDALLLHQQPIAVQRTVRRLAALGADRVRITAGWSALAPRPRAPARPDFDPTNPSQYKPGPMRALDTAVKAAKAAGLDVQLDLAFWAPRWAVSRRVRQRDRQRWRPNPLAFGQFASAIAKRYRGDFPDPTSTKRRPLPAVHLWTTWNEPNHPSFLLPQSERMRSGGWRDVAPHIYRALHEAAYNALTSVSVQNRVLIGGLSSRGASKPGPTRNIPPLRFVRELACVDEKLEPLDDPACRQFHPLRADGFAYHPYSFDAAPDVVYGGPDEVHIADLARLKSLLAELHKRGRIAGELPLYLTEFGYESRPPDNGRGVPPETQARYLSQAAFLAWRDTGVRMFAQFLFEDIADPASYQTGLLFPDGREKPALQAFKMPFWAQAQQKDDRSFVLAWGQIRPGKGSQKVELEIQGSDGVWRAIPSLPAGTGKGDGRNCPAEQEQFLTDRDGFYLRAVSYEGVVAYRARWTREDGGVEYAPPVTVGTPVPAAPMP
jgi:hypothetical protein